LRAATAAYGFTPQDGHATEPEQEDQELDEAAEDRNQRENANNDQADQQGEPPIVSPGIAHHHLADGEAARIEPAHSVNAKSRAPMIANGIPMMVIATSTNRIGMPMSATSP